MDDDDETQAYTYQGGSQRRIEMNDFVNPNNKFFVNSNTIINV